MAVSSMQGLHIEEIQTAAELEALRKDWSELWERCPAAGPFQSAEWQTAWRRRLGRGRLWVLAVRQGGRLCGLAPFCIGPYYGLPLRAVQLLGTGVSDSLDLLLEPEYARAA